MSIKTMWRNTLLTITGITLIGSSAVAQKYETKQIVRDWQLPNGTGIIVPGATYATSPLLTLDQGPNQTISILPNSILPTSAKVYGYENFIQDETRRINHYSQDPTLQSRLDRDRIALQEFQKAKGYKVGTAAWDVVFLDSLQKCANDGNFTQAEKYMLSGLVTKEGLDVALAGVQVSHPSGTITLDGKTVNVPAENTPIGLRIPALSATDTVYVPTPETKKEVPSNEGNSKTGNVYNYYITVVNEESNKSTTLEDITKNVKPYLGVRYDISPFNNANYNGIISADFGVLFNDQISVGASIGHKNHINGGHEEQSFHNPKVNGDHSYFKDVNSDVLEVGVEFGAFVNKSHTFKVNAGLSFYSTRSDITGSSFDYTVDKTEKWVLDNAATAKSGSLEGIAKCLPGEGNNDNDNGCDKNHNNYHPHNNNNNNTHTNEHNTTNNNGGNTTNNNCGNTTTTNTTTTINNNTTITTTTTVTNNYTTINNTTINNTTNNTYIIPPTGHWEFTTIEKTVATPIKDKAAYSDIRLNLGGEFRVKKYDMAVKAAVSVPVFEKYSNSDMSNFSGSVGIVKYF